MLVVHYCMTFPSVVAQNLVLTELAKLLTLRRVLKDHLLSGVVEVINTCQSSVLLRGIQAETGMIL